MAGNLNTWAERTFEKYKRQVAQLMGVRPVDVQFVVESHYAGDDPNHQHPAWTSGTVIHIVKPWLDQHPNDEGMVVHEMVHAFLGTGSSGDKWHEQYADFIRGKLGLSVDSSEQNAQFFTWLDRQDPTALRRLGQEMADGSYQGADFKNIVGVNYEKAREAFDNGDNLQPHADDPNVIGYHGGHTGVDPKTGQPVGSDGGGNQPGTVGGIEADYNNDGVISQDEYNRFIKSSGGGDGNGGHKRDMIREKRNAISMYTNTLMAWGIPIDQNLTQLMQEGADKRYSADTFLRYLRDTPEYRAAFQGIFKKDGTLRMTEDQYIQTMKDYASVASQAGVNMPHNLAVWAIKHDVTPSEYADRATAISSLNRNKDLFANFSKELAQTGLAGPKGVTKAELAKFVLGTGNKAWKDLWQDAVTRNSAVMAGLTFKKHADGYLDLHRNVIERISGRDMTAEQMDQAFQLASSLLLSDLPAAKIQGLGLKKHEVVAAAFGGHGSAEARAKLSRIETSAKAQADNEIAAGPAFVGEGGRLTSQGGGKQGYTE
jgi:hypothetical protein